MALPVVIIGSGIVGTAIAHELVQAGRQVLLLEKGSRPESSVAQTFAERVFYGHRRELTPGLEGLDGVSQAGAYRGDLGQERVMAVGGGATVWGAMTDRLHPHDFQVNSRYGYAADWPITYADLEPYYVAAERLLGVAGSDEGDPFAPPRSAPYPLPPFPMSYDVQLIAGRLRRANIHLRNSPQARTSRAYDGRPACQNFGTCAECPIGARYSPTHHLEQAIETGRCQLRERMAVRRILVDSAGRARAVVARNVASGAEEEIPAGTVVLAAGAIESARLLLLSAGPGREDGLGNQAGHVGRHLMFHHIWAGHLDFAEELFPGRTGAEMGQSRQFLDPRSRGRHGGLLLQIPANWHSPFHQPPDEPVDGFDVLQTLRARIGCELVWLHAESAPDPAKSVGLGERRDRFGDSLAHVEYSSSEFDEQTYQFARSVLERVASAAGSTDSGMFEMENYSSGFHHMGTCRMSAQADDGVVDGLCRVHGTRNLYVVGGASFPSVGSVHPTLTMVALALRVAAHLKGARA